MNIFFDKPVKNKQEAYEKIVLKNFKMSINNDFTTGTFLDYLYHQKYHKPISIVLLR